MMTKRDALARYASAYKAWRRGQLHAADLLAAEIRAKHAGASLDELNQAIAPKPQKKEPAP